MNIKTITPVSTEILSLTEVKTHLRLDIGDITTEQLLVPDNRSADTYTSSGVDVIGKNAIVNLNSGTNQATGTVDVHIEESDDNVTYTDWSTAFTQITTANDNAVYEKQYKGNKQYIRVVAVVSNAECDFSVDLIYSDNSNVEDTYLSSLITVAREYCETVTRRGLGTQTLELILDDFSNDYIELPKSPVQSITSIKYKDSDSTETTWTDYVSDTDKIPALIMPEYGDTFPSFTPYPSGAVRIRYVAGHTTSDIPKSIKQAMLLLIGHLYENREETIAKKLENIPLGIQALLSTYRVWGW
jgi:uncharacterized phiE125 gp8 family phage protein